ncbi:Ltp family lipoprotein [Halobacillus litoralis]|nr:Ltp family lipoprotein [Halobacillus litoralis]
METFLMILMLTALAGAIVFFVLGFVKGKDNRLKNFAKSGACLFASLALGMIVGATDGAFQTFLGILMLTALAGVLAFFVLAFVKGKGNRLGNFAKSGGCLFALLVIALIAGAISEETPVAEEVTAIASAEDKEQEEQEAKEQAQKEQEEREAEEQAEKEQEEREVEEQAQKEQEEREAEEQAQKEQEEQEAKEQEQKEQEAKEAEEQAKKEEEERKAKEEEERKAKEASVTVSQEQAVAMAQQYLNYTAFSKSGLIDQLKFEGFSTEDATYGVENITVDWQEQAVVMAQHYLDYTSFSRQGLIDQLTFEGFSTEHATYAVSQVGF